MVADDQHSTEVVKTAAATPTRDRKRKSKCNMRNKVQRKKRRISTNEAILTPASLPQVIEIIDSLEIIQPVEEAQEEFAIDAIVLIAHGDDEGNSIMPEETVALTHAPLRTAHNRHTTDLHHNYSDSIAFSKLDAYLALQEEEKKAYNDLRGAQLESFPRSVQERELKANEPPAFFWPVGRGDPIYVVMYDEAFDGPSKGLPTADGDFNPTFNRAPTLPRRKH